MTIVKTCIPSVETSFTFYRGSVNIILNNIINNYSFRLALSK